MINYSDILGLATILGAGAVVSNVIATPLINYLHRKGIVRPDVHKPGRPLIAHSGGIILIISFTVSTFSSIIFFPQYTIEILTIWFTAFLCFLIGLIDDIVILPGKTKTILTTLSILPIVISTTLFPRRIIIGRPLVPIIGRIRLTILYWVLLPLAIAGPANAVNMLDVMNGIMPGTMIIASIAILFSSVVLGSKVGLIVAVILLGILIGYYPYNRYPAKVFNGDSGSLMIGGILGAVAVISRMEFIILTVLLPHVLNAYLVISSIGGLKEHRQLRERPIKVTKDGLLIANPSPTAPLSLTRLILLLGGEGREHEVVKVYLIVEAVSSILAIAVAFLMVM